jgi:hypothetical protein
VLYISATPVQRCGVVVVLRVPVMIVAEMCVCLLTVPSVVLQSQTCNNVEYTCDSAHTYSAPIRHIRACATKVSVGFIHKFKA